MSVRLSKWWKGLVPAGVVLVLIFMVTRRDGSARYTYLPDSFLQQEVAIESLDSAVAKIAANSGQQESRWLYKVVSGPHLRQFAGVWFIRVNAISRKTPILEYFDRMTRRGPSGSGRWQLLIAVDERSGEAWTLRDTGDNLSGFGNFLGNRGFEIKTLPDCEELWKIAAELKWVHGDGTFEQISAREWHLRNSSSSATLIVKVAVDGVVTSVTHVDRL